MSHWLRLGLGYSRAVQLPGAWVYGLTAFVSRPFAGSLSPVTGCDDLHHEKQLHLEETGNRMKTRALRREKGPATRKTERRSQARISTETPETAEVQRTAREVRGKNPKRRKTLRKSPVSPERGEGGRGTSRGRRAPEGRVPRARAVGTRGQKRKPGQRAGRGLPRPPPRRTHHLCPSTYTQGLSMGQCPRRFGSSLGLYHVEIQDAPK